MIVIAGSAKVRPDRIDTLIAVAARMAESSRSEAGCQEYRFAIDVDDPTTVRLFEQWTSQEALDAHFATPHFAEFSTAIADALAESPEFTRYEIAASGPLFG